MLHLPKWDPIGFDPQPSDEPPRRTHSQIVGCLVVQQPSARRTYSQKVTIEAKHIRAGSRVSQRENHLLARAHVAFVGAAGHLLRTPRVFATFRSSLYGVSVCGL